MGFIRTHTIEEIFHRLFKEQGRASRIEVIRDQVERGRARPDLEAGASQLNDIRSIVHEAGLAFDLFCHDRVAKGLIYPENWRPRLEASLEEDEEFWFFSEDGPMFEGRGDKAAAKRVLSTAPGAPPPWHGKSPREIAENHDWTVCLKLLASEQYLFELDSLITAVNEWPNAEGQTFLANSCYTEDQPALGGFEL